MGPPVSGISEGAGSSGQWQVHPTWKHPDLKAQQPLSPVSGSPESRRDRPASSSALFLPRTGEVQAVIRKKQGWGCPMWEEDMEQLVYIDVHTRNVGRWDVGTGRGKSWA